MTGTLRDLANAVVHHIDYRLAPADGHRPVSPVGEEVANMVALGTCAVIGHDFEPGYGEPTCSTCAMPQGTPRIALGAGLPPSWGHFLTRLVHR